MLCAYVNSEYGFLRAIMLARPHPYITGAPHPEKILHLQKIDDAIIQNEYDRLIKVYKKLGIKIFFIHTRPQKENDNLHLFNIMFTRDLFFMTPRGCILSRMFSEVRRDEVKYVERKLRAIHVHIRKAVDGDGTFEGADALWVHDKLVVVGVGKRTNQKGFQQVKETLKQDNIKCVGVPAPQKALHLLGAIQCVASDLALVRIALVDKMIVNLLRKNNMRVVSIPENQEITMRQAMNIVTVAPRKIIIPEGCPLTRMIYEKAGLTVIAEVPISQLARGGGGLACATGIVARYSPSEPD